MNYRLPVSAGIAMCAILAVATTNLAQDVDRGTAGKLIPRFGRDPRTGGTPEDAVAASKSGATIPLSTYSISPTKVKEKKPLTGTIVGTSPFDTTLSGSTIDAVVVPVIFNIGGTMFDPTAIATAASPR